MNISLIVPALTAAVSVGIGCGTCCSPVISTFLSTYVVSHAGGVKKGLLSFVSFFFGKMVSVSLLCVIAALVSRQFISEEGYIGSFNLRLFSQAAMSSIGVVMIMHDRDCLQPFQHGRPRAAVSDCDWYAFKKDEKGDTGRGEMVPSGILCIADSYALCI